MGKCASFPGLRVVIYLSTSGWLAAATAFSAHLPPSSSIIIIITSLVWQEGPVPRKQANRSPRRTLQGKGRSAGGFRRRVDQPCPEIFKLERGRHHTCRNNRNGHQARATPEPLCQKRCFVLLFLDCLISHGTTYK